MSKKGRSSTSTITAVLILLGVIIIYSVVIFFYQHRIMKTLTEEECRTSYRKAQLVDIREPNEFKNGHILGAGNIPFSQFRMRIKEFRPNQPGYIYCQSRMRTGRAAQMLRRHGVQEIYDLKGGFKIQRQVLLFPHFLLNNRNLNRIYTFFFLVNAMC